MKIIVIYNVYSPGAGADSALASFIFKNIHFLLIWSVTASFTL